MVGRWRRTRRRNRDEFSGEGSGEGRRAGRAFPLVRPQRRLAEVALADEGRRSHRRRRCPSGWKSREAANAGKERWCATALHCEQKGNCGGCSFCGGAVRRRAGGDVVLAASDDPYTHAAARPATARASKIVCEKQQRVRSRVVARLRRRGRRRGQVDSQPVRIAFAAEERTEATLGASLTRVWQPFAAARGRIGGGGAGGRAESEGGGLYVIVRRPLGPPRV